MEGVNHDCKRKKLIILLVLKIYLLRRKINWKILKRKITKFDISEET